MKTEHTDHVFGEFLEQAAPEMTDGWEERATEALHAVNPARVRSHWRVLPIAAGAAAVVILALSLVPSWQGERAWAFAQAAAARADSLHVTGRILVTDWDCTFERWITADGFRRYETRDGEDGWLVSFNQQDGQRDAWFFVGKEGKHGLVKTAVPGIGGPTPVSRGDALVDLLQLIPFMNHCADLELRTWEERDTNGRVVEVIEGQGTFEGELHAHGYGDFYRGMPLMFQATVLQETGLLLSLECWRGAGQAWHQDIEGDKPRERPGLGGIFNFWRPSGEWERIFTTEKVEWNVPVPAAVSRLDWPEGTRVQVQHWLDTRGNQELGRAAVTEGEVVLHALDVNRRGDIFITVSRPGRGVLGAPDCLRVENMDFAVVDDRGRPYGQSNHYFGGMCGFAREYEVTDLRGGYGVDDDTRSRSVTVTVWPFSDEWHTGESVTFRDVPLPEPQHEDMLYDAAAEVIQY
ncbi:MAG: hypothetical protein JXA57_10995 [Armatimonadetes bacterium]|nr:hypothetical protein [Armatimonadota bacterium]